MRRRQRPRGCYTEQRSITTPWCVYERQTDGKGAACTTVDEDLGAMQSEAGAAEADRDGGER